jgi:sugar O-acyltransferase (sialic acid O-acetyltransferase NeuD family)
MNLIFGASGHATEVEWLTQVCSQPAGHQLNADYFVVPDNAPPVQALALPVITELQAQQLTTSFNGFIAVGNSTLRQKIWRKFDKPTASWPVLIHPSVLFDSRPGMVNIGRGCILFPGSTLTSKLTLGQHVHVNVGCSISHDVRIADFCTLSPGVHLAGRVSLGEHVFLGLGAVVVEDISICANTIIGAGAVVVHDIVEPGTYVGVPVRKIK